MMEKHRKFMKGDAGFSLVELIIVIAIMAALVAILAPQYLKYVEASRVSADQTQLDEIMKAVKIAAVDPETSVTPGVVTITIAANTGVGTVNAEALGTVAKQSVYDALGGNTVSFKSKYLKKSAATQIDITVTDDTVVWGSGPEYTNNPYPTFTG
jgi:type IV pilus assembly protein PilA